MYTSFAYSTSIFLVELPYWFVSSFLFLISYHFMIGMPASMFGKHLLANYLVTIVSALAGQFLIASLPNPALKSSSADPGAAACEPHRLCKYSLYLCIQHQNLSLRPPYALSSLLWMTIYYIL